MCNELLGAHVAMIYPCDFVKEELETLDCVPYWRLEAVTNYFMLVLSLILEVLVSFGIFCFLRK